MFSLSYLVFSKLQNKKRLKNLGKIVKSRVKKIPRRSLRRKPRKLLKKQLKRIPKRILRKRTKKEARFKKRKRKKISLMKNK